MQAHRKPRAAAMTIDGEAVVLERRSAEARPVPQRPEEPINDNRPDDVFPARPPQQRPDLVFPGRTRWLSTADRTAERRASRIGWAATAGTSVAALAAVALIVASRLGAPVPAASAGFELTDTRTMVSTHREGPVLAVEGRIRNVSARAGTPPEITVRLGQGDGGLSRSFRPGASVLEPGASLFFHSTLALPSATSGTIAVSLSRAAERKSMTR